MKVILNTNNMIAWSLSFISLCGISEKPQLSKRVFTLAVRIVPYTEHPDSVNLVKERTFCIVYLPYAKTRADPKRSFQDPANEV